MRAHRPPLPLLLGFAAFLTAIVVIVAASLVPRKVTEFAPTPPGAPSGGPGPDTVTMDAADEGHWRFYSFRRGVLSPPDTADWDLGFRRHHVIASGSVADAGANPSFEAVAAAGVADASANTSFEGGVAAARVANANAIPSSEGGVAAAVSAFMKTEFAADTLNPALAHWYRYSFVTHLLRPNGHVFLVRARSGALVKLEFLGYYCPGTRAGCPTFRWDWLAP